MYFLQLLFFVLPYTSRRQQRAGKKWTTSVLTSAKQQQSQTKGPKTSSPTAKQKLAVKLALGGKIYS